MGLFSSDFDYQSFIKMSDIKKLSNLDESKEEKTMGNVRLAKYETLIEDINGAIKKKRTPGAINASVKRSFFWTIENEYIDGNTALALIFDYNKCNDYVKIIMDKSELIINSSDNTYTDLWKSKHTEYNEFSDVKKTIDASKEFVQFCRMPENITEGYKFIFWALLILTVDKTDAEEHLSLICDFAKMLHITDEEFEDIIQTIKVIYNEVTSDYTFKSKRIPEIFGPLFHLYANKDIEETTEE